MKILLLLTMLFSASAFADSVSHSEMKLFDAEIHNGENGQEVSVPVLMVAGAAIGVSPFLTVPATFQLWGPILFVTAFDTRYTGKVMAVGAVVFLVGTSVLAAMLASKYGRGYGIFAFVGTLAVFGGAVAAAYTLFPDDTDWLPRLGVFAGVSAVGSALVMGSVGLMFNAEMRENVE